MANSMVTAYDDMPRFSINPINMSSFTRLCQSMVDLVDSGVPANSDANEQSTMNRYRIPFCEELGTTWERPTYVDLNSQ